LNFQDVKELHYITHIENISSICRHGIFSHKQAGGFSHVSVASRDVQERRAKKIIPGGLALHAYVNFYFDARNPMMYVLQAKHAELCILQIDPAVMNLPGAIVADRNASSDYARFFPCPGGLKYLNKDMIFAASWTHPNNQFEEWEHKSIKCAEVLVPDKVATKYLLGAYVSCNEALIFFQRTNVSMSAIVNSQMFFR
jgi:hypothetical protein